MDLWKKAVIAASCIAAAVFAGYLSHAVGPAVAAPEQFGSDGPRGTGEAMPITLLGQLRMSLDDYLWLKTDDYLHYGIAHRSYAEVRLAKSMREAAAAGIRRLEGRPDEAAPIPLAGRGWRGFFEDLELYRPVKGIHGDPKELMPWYRVQTTVNPLDVRAYVNGAFFLTDFAKRPEEAHAFLEKGLKNNPGSHEIHQAMGRLYFEKRKDYDKAAPYFEKAVALGKEIEDRDEMQEKALGDAYLFLARVYRQKGDLDAALRTAEEGVAVCTEHALVKAILRIVTKDMDRKTAPEFREDHKQPARNPIQPPA